MEHYLSKENHIFKFSEEAEPVLRINPGDTVVVETMDCFSNQIQTANDKLEEISFDHVNPATGPIFVEGAEKGDALKVTIDKIEVGSQAVMLTGKGLGVLGHKLEGMNFKLLPVVGETVIFDDYTTLPLEPMVGVIGVAPEGEGINCGTPDAHGGNMDTKLIRPGAEVYLPVSVEGGMLALGDLHAAMGDGEVSVSGAEVPGEVTITVSLVKGLKLQTPVVVNNGVLAVICSKESLDDAVVGAVEIMEEIVRERTELSTAEIAMLISVAGEVAISQVVDPLKTARCEMPLAVLGNYGFKLY